MRASKPTEPENARIAVFRSIRAACKDELTVSVEVAGKLLGIGRDAAYAAARSDRMPTIKVSNRRWRVSVVALEDLLLCD